MNRRDFFTLGAAAGHWPAVMGLGALVVVGWAVRRALGNWQRRARPVRSPGEPGVSRELAALMRRADACWAAAGFPRPDVRGPLEHLDRLPPGALPDASAVAARRAVHAYYAARYGGEPLGAEVLARLADRLPSA